MLCAIKTVALVFLTFLTVAVTAQQKIVFRQLHKTDSLQRAIAWVDKEFTTKEKQCHAMIWNLHDIRQRAIDLKKNGADAFTMTDEWPSPESEYFVVGFYQMQLLDKIMDSYARLSTYRISRRMKLEVYNPDDDSWNTVADVSRKN